MRKVTHLYLKGSYEMEIETKQYTNLSIEVRYSLPTNDAAFHLHRKPQTLRSWACFENGPIKPIKVNGRLTWLVSDIKKIMGGN